jgi:hypothetical protein
MELTDLIREIFNQCPSKLKQEVVLWNHRDSDDFEAQYICITLISTENSLLLGIDEEQEKEKWRLRYVPNLCSFLSVSCPFRRLYSIYAACYTWERIV